MNVNWGAALIVCIGANIFWALFFTDLKMVMWDKWEHKKYSHLPFYQQEIQKYRYIGGVTKTELWISYISLFPVFFTMKTILVLYAMAKAAFEALKYEITHW